MDTIQSAKLGRKLAATRSGAAVNPKMKRSGAAVCGPLVVALLGALPVRLAAGAESIPPASPGLRADAPVDPNRPYAQEINSSAAADLVIALAGSVFIDTSAATLPPWDPKVVELLNGTAFPATTTVAVADLQTTLVDPAAFPGYPYAWDAQKAYAAPGPIALELKENGLQMLSRANAHALDWGIDGMRATDAVLDAAGLNHAGTGDREGLARMASFLEQPGGKGRIALLATATYFRQTTNALSAHGVAPGRPGISGIEVTPHRLVPAQQRKELQLMACRFQHPDDPQHCEHLPAAPANITLFGNQFQSGDTPRGDYTSEFVVNRVQVANELRSVREAKQNSDLVVLAIGTGQGALEEPSANLSLAALQGLAHSAIDAGADVVMATGAASLGPIEIYRSAAGPLRPIIYGTGRLYFSPDIAPAADRSDEHESIIVRTSLNGNRLKLEVYPIDLTAPNGSVGLPRLAAMAEGRSILERLQRLSLPFHTVVRTEPYGATVRGVIEAEESGSSPARGGT
jgi:poly-gamma-glutamate capsule biosynthesis protein CapA/YwtB (metallophosphatase superfamily)